MGWALVGVHAFIRSKIRGLDAAVADNFTIQFNSSSVKLTQREFELFAFLLARAGSLVSRKELMEGIWGASPDLATRTIDQHAYRIRKVLQLDGSHGLSLDTVYGYG